MRRRVVQVQNQRINVAIVVRIPECSTTAGELLADSRAHLRGNILKPPVSQVFVYQTWILKLLRTVSLVNLWINVAIDLHDVGPAVVIKVGEATSPSDITIVDCDPGWEGHIGKASVSIVVIQVAGIVGKIGFEDVEPSIAVVVGNRNSHACLLVSILAVSAACCDGDVSERTVVVVVIQNAGLGVYRNINVRPAVVVKIVRDRGD